MEIVFNKDSPENGIFKLYMQHLCDTGGKFFSSKLDVSFASFTSDKVPLRFFLIFSSRVKGGCVYI